MARPVTQDSDAQQYRDILTRITRLEQSVSLVGLVGASAGPGAGPAFGGAGLTYATVTMDTSGGPVLLMFSGYAQHNGVNGTQYQLQVAFSVDGGAGDVFALFESSTNGNGAPVAGHAWLPSLDAGSHVFSATIAAVTATPAIGMYRYRITAVEVGT